jgi:hypothetical protein
MVDAPWRHPELDQLDVPSLIIEANSKLDLPFKMPHDMRKIAEQLARDHPSVTNLQSLRALSLDEKNRVLVSAGLDGEVAALALQLHTLGS